MSIRNKKASTISSHTNPESADDDDTDDATTSLKLFSLPSGTDYRPLATTTTPAAIQVDDKSEFCRLLAALSDRVRARIGVPTPSGDERDDGGDSDDGVDDTASSASSESLVSLVEEEFPDYFDHRDRRLFHSHGNNEATNQHRCSYVLPVDGHELRRYNTTHEFLKRVIGANYDAPFAAALAPTSGHRLIVLDFGTGTGIWTMEMAREFPLVKFRGLDVVPIATRYPEDNVRFELTDVRDRLRFATGSVDVVHIRDAHLSVADYASALVEAARVLRPGGLFVAGEWGHYTLDPNTQPAAARFWTAVNEAINGAALGPNCPALARALPALLQATEAFGQVDESQRVMPLAAPGEPGDALRKLVYAYAEAVRAAVPGTSDLAHEWINEIERGVQAGGMDERPVMVWHAVWAKRL